MYRGCHGLSDIENGTRMSPSTAVRIASISKSFTSLMIAQQLEQEKLTLTDKIQKYIDFPDKESDITISRLLNHTSGLRHYSKKKKISDLTDDEKVNTNNEFQSCTRYNSAHEATQVKHEF